MSEQFVDQTDRQWDDGVVGATEILVEREGVEGAIKHLNDRRRKGEDTGRANEALAWVKRFGGQS